MFLFIHTRTLFILCINTTKTHIYFANGKPYSCISTKYKFCNLLEIQNQFHSLSIFSVSSFAYNLIFIIMYIIR